MAHDASGWIDSAEQADDTLAGIRWALVAIAHSLQELAELAKAESEEE